MKPLKSFYKGKHILITGGLGFLGSTLAHALVKLNADVTIYDALLPEYGGNIFNVQDIKQKVKIIKKDIRDESSMQRAVENQDVIFNIAAQTSHVDSMKDPFLDLDINGRGQLVLLEACREINPRVKIIYAGSRAQYGAVDKLPVTEETPMVPIDIYGAHKILGEHYHFIYQRICGLRPVSLRLTNIYGPRHQMKHAKYGVQNYFLRLIIDNREVPIFGNGKQRRDFLYVEDAIEAFLQAGVSEKAVGQAFIISPNRPISLVDFVKEAIEIARSGSLVFREFTKERKQIETGDFFGDPRKFQSLTGWNPRVGLRDGLQQTIDFYRKHKHHYWTT